MICLTPRFEIVWLKPEVAPPAPLQGELYETRLAQREINLKGVGKAAPVMKCCFLRGGERFFAHNRLICNGIRVLLRQKAEDSQTEVLPLQ